MRSKHFDDLYAGWIWHERAGLPVSHAVTRNGPGPKAIARHRATFSMHQLETFAEPKGDVCHECADYVRKQLLSRVVELAKARTPLSPTDAQAMLAELAERAKAVS